MSEPPENQEASTQLPGKDSQIAHKLWLGLWITFCALLVATAGFASFTEKSRKLARPATVAADGIVVLTGGSERISAAVRLLEKKSAKRLLITGVHPATTRTRLRRLVKADASLFKCCVDLDRRAPDTRGNAAEAAQWATSNKFKSLAVVTSDYHILRAMIEFSRAMPEVGLVAYPVSGSDSGDPTRSATTFRLWLNEYIKYLLALVRIQAGD
jgi:uncharacterized SAM-binding protein YcdF (DUF218 family)